VLQLDVPRLGGVLVWNGVRCKENGVMELVSNLLSEVRGECSFRE
jgi:hypothetical protein